MRIFPYSKATFSEVTFSSNVFATVSVSPLIIYLTAMQPNEEVKRWVDHESLLTL